MKRGRTTGPNGKCQICRHPERERLEHLFARGASRNAVGLKFGVSGASVVRHWQRHVPPHVKAAASTHALRPGVELEKLVMDESIGLLDHLQEQERRRRVSLARVLGARRRRVSLARVT
jgi:hypothetical protein